MRSSWIIPKSSGKCSYKRQKRRHRYTEGEFMENSSRHWSDAATIKEHLETPEAERDK